MSSLTLKAYADAVRRYGHLRAELELTAIGMMEIRKGRRLHFAPLVTLCVLLAVAACTDAATPTLAPTPTPTKEILYDLENARAELAAARALWEARGSSDYVVDVKEDAVGDGPGNSFRVTVRDGVLVEAIWLDGYRAGERVPRSWLDGYSDYARMSIDALFGRIASELRGTPPWSFTGKYDPYYGYPTRFIAGENAPDNVWGLSFSNYRPLTPQPTATPSAASQAAPERRASVMDLFAAGDNAALSIGPAATAIYALYQSR